MMRLGPTNFPFHGPNRLWSLWDMLQINLRSYLHLAREMEDQRNIFFMIEAANESDAESGRPQTAKLDDDEAATLKNRIDRMERFASELELGHSAALMATIMRDDTYPKTGGEWDLLAQSINIELKERLILYIPEYRAKHYDQAAPAWAVAPHFPSAAAEVASAGNCFAAGENTACVFHLMRVCEVGLRTLATKVGTVMTSDSATWGELLRDIQGKIKKMQTGGRTVPKEELEFYSEAAAHFRNIKDAWRNYVSHARGPCTENEALKLLRDVPDFMAHLATRLGE